MSCWQFEAEWERIHSELEEVGLAQPPREKMLAYICKIGPVSETIRMDRRPRRNTDGSYTTRLPETWEECHEVLCELEGARAGTKAFTAARAGGVRQKPPKVKPQDWEVPTGGAKGKGKNKGKNKTSSPSNPNGQRQRLSQSERTAIGPCFEFKKNGKCKYGDTCKYSHLP